MNLSSVAARLFSASAQATRMELRQCIGEHFHATVGRAQAKHVDVARALGVDASHVGKIYQGLKPLLAIDLWLLPHAVLQPIVADLASVLGMELRPSTSAPELAPREHVARCVSELTGVITQAVTAQADEYESADEARAELAAWDRADRLSAERRAHLEHVIAQGGARVVPMPARKGAA